MLWQYNWYQICSWTIPRARIEAGSSRRKSKRRKIIIFVCLQVNTVSACLCIAVIMFHSPLEGLHSWLFRGCLYFLSSFFFFSLFCHYSTIYLKCLFKVVPSLFYLWLKHELQAWFDIYVYVVSSSISALFWHMLTISIDMSIYYRYSEATNPGLKDKVCSRPYWLWSASLYVRECAFLTW